RDVPTRGARAAATPAGDRRPRRNGAAGGTRNRPPPLGPAGARAEAARSECDVDRLAVLGHAGAPAELLDDSMPQPVGRLGLAVHDVDLARCGAQAAHPVEQLVSI